MGSIVGQCAQPDDQVGGGMDGIEKRELLRQHESTKVRASEKLGEDGRMIGMRRHHGPASTTSSPLKSGFSNP